MALHDHPNSTISFYERVNAPGKIVATINDHAEAERLVAELRQLDTSATYKVQHHLGGIFARHGRLA